ncbi:hypothetical protein DFJ43DRAFT_646128 [Lentinula guzmanii]|uniref:Uncharacterized protein n=1 Tax=Lentinula guzmanii TaxID=2804957 RepID=A0AA38MYA4_9AGAR|nr:hypothetical protein DFJ43DRAFT_646128 [Lentinula guzmanii]
MPDIQSLLPLHHTSDQGLYPNPASTASLLRWHLSRIRLGCFFQSVKMMKVVKVVVNEEKKVKEKKKSHGSRVDDHSMVKRMSMLMLATVVYISPRRSLSTGVRLPNLNQTTHHPRITISSAQARWARYFRPLTRSVYWRSLTHLVLVNFPFALAAWVYLFVFTVVCVLSYQVLTIRLTVDLWLDWYGIVYRLTTRSYLTCSALVHFLVQRYRSFILLPFRCSNLTTVSFFLLTSYSYKQDSTALFIILFPLSLIDARVGSPLRVFPSLPNSSLVDELLACAFLLFPFVMDEAYIEYAAAVPPRY